MFVEALAHARSTASGPATQGVDHDPALGLGLGVLPFKDDLGLAGFKSLELSEHILSGWFHRSVRHLGKINKKISAPKTMEGESEEALKMTGLFFYKTSRSRNRIKSSQKDSFLIFWKM